MNHQIIATVDFRHSFFANGIFKSIQVKPVIETLNFLRRHRLSVRQEVGRLVVYSAEKRTNLTALAGQNLRFVLSCSDPQWTSYTDASHTCLQHPRLYSTVKASKKGELSVSELEGIKTRNGFALLDIQLSAALLKRKTPASFSLSFKARQVHWEYFLVTNMAESADAFCLQDTSDDKPIVFHTVDKTKGDEQHQHPRQIQHLVASLPGAHCIHFRSHKPVTCQQKAIPHIQLKKQDSILLHNIGNPSLENIHRFKSESDEGGPWQSTQFGVIRYMTQAF